MQKLHHLHLTHLENLLHPRIQYTRKMQKAAYRHSVLIAVFTLIATDGRRLSSAVKAVAECHLRGWPHYDRWYDDEEALYDLGARIEKWADRVDGQMESRTYRIRHGIHSDDGGDDDDDEDGDGDDDDDDDDLDDIINAALRSSGLGRR